MQSQTDARALIGQKTRAGQLAGLELTRSEMNLKPKPKLKLRLKQTSTVNASPKRYKSAEVGGKRRADSNLVKAVSNGFDSRWHTPPYQRGIRGELSSRKYAFNLQLSATTRPGYGQDIALIQLASSSSSSSSSRGNWNGDGNGNGSSSCQDTQLERSLNHMIPDKILVSLTLRNSIN
ncbi:hypothetical protein AWZ03_004686 [Drosophila navojoa]|uniref:Uncharacterized protein n=1 Tax=Drosophila navojoa TaxID=7232 RepID=A0A484BJ08_DRONA|nr:hypothetical protein AWZ03_004686 [Drosophila navojoa]